LSGRLRSSCSSTCGRFRRAASRRPEECDCDGRCAGTAGTLRRPCREPIREPARSSVNGASVQSALASGGVRCPAMHRAMWTQGPGIHHFANGALATAGDGACAKVPYRGAEPAPRTASAWNARQTPSPRFRHSAPWLSSTSGCLPPTQHRDPVSSFYRGTAASAVRSQQGPFRHPDSALCDAPRRFADVRTSVIRRALDDHLP
jgi:hypothetical protein